MRFAIDDLVVDTERLTVERDGTTVRVQPQVFDVMSHLVTNRDRVVPKEELLDEVWGDRFVSESTLSSRIKSVRQLLGDDGVSQSVVKTFHGRGFRWVADIDVFEDEPAHVSTPPGVPTFPPPIRPVPPPVLPTETLGRDETIDEVAAALAIRRTVTLIGSPGIGKTRIALEALQRVDDDRRAVSFVELHTATSRADILRLVRQGVGLDRDLGFAATGESSDDDLERWLVDRLAATSLLLVLDNCEHVADRVATFVRALLTSAPSVTILATSRRPLWVDGEQLVVVRPLDQPLDASWADLCSSAAGRLFVERSTAAGAVWSESDDEAEMVREICRRLDGVPLAIELVAARMRWMPVSRLLSDLAEPAGDRWTGGGPLAMSLQASRELLDASTREAFDTLSVFAGTFSLDAALSVISTVCPSADPVEVFEQLIDHSLVDVADRQGGRYRLLAPVRKFAASGEPRIDAASRALLAHYADVVERTWPPGSTQPPWPRDALDADMGDILNLLERAGSVDAAGCRRLVGSMGLFWWMGDETQRCVAICEQLGEPDDDDDVAAAARYLWTWCMCSSLLWQPAPERAERAHRLAIETGQWSVAASALSLAVAGDHVWADLDAVEGAWNEIEALYRRAGDVAGEAWALVRVLGHAQGCAGRSSEAATSFRAAVDLYRRIGDRVGVATAALRLAREAIWIGSDVDTAEEALALVDEDIDGATGDLPALPHRLRYEAAWYGGRVAEAQGETEVALERHRAALAISEEHVPGSVVANTMRVHLAGFLRRTGRLSEAATCLREAIDTVLRSTAKIRWAHSTWVLESLAGLLAELNRPEDAATLFGAAEGARERLNASMPTWDRPGYERDVASISSSSSVSAAWDEGRHLDLEGACRLAMSLCESVEERRPLVGGGRPG